MKTVAFTTLGCRVNQYDTDAMKGLFLQNNYEAVDFDEKAEQADESLNQQSFHR